MNKGYSRREFLKTVVITAGAVQAASVVAACGSDNNGTPDAPMPDGPSPADAPRPDAGPALSYPQSVASGDPRTTSIVLWTRAVPAGGGDATVTLQVATDANFTNLVTLSTSSLTAAAAADNCLRAKITGLAAATTYFYRFTSLGVTSKTGRFRTAPASTADVQVRFAYLSCQDYTGRFYNTLVELLDPSNDDLAFVAHLGDYVYETTGDPRFQEGSGRKVVFSDQAGAIPMGSGAGMFYAAKSLSNYRELYKTFRSDPNLQQVHEKFAFINIWDDHEYSDDCWQDVATYFNGVVDETDMTRRRNAEQAFFEYTPIALDAEGDGALSLTGDQLWPNEALYRDFRFGKHLHLIMTDFRSHRADHPIPESSWPGNVVMDEAAVLDTLPALYGDMAQDTFDMWILGDPPLLRTYVNLDDAMYAAQKTQAKIQLTAKYVAAGCTADRANTLATAAAQGNVAIDDLNALWTGLSADQMTALHVAPANPSHGVSYGGMGKFDVCTLLGARYLVVKPTYDLWAVYRTVNAPATEEAYGTVQDTWLDGRLAAETDATWKVFASSTSQTSFIVDLAPFASGLVGSGIPPTQLYLDCDGWDGFPELRKALHTKLAAANAVIISGDVHAAFMADFKDDEGVRMGLLEMTGPAVSSEVFREELRDVANQVPALMGNPMVGVLIDLLDCLLTTASTFFANTDLLLSNSAANGVVTVTLDGTQLKAEYALLDFQHATTDLTASPETIRSMFVRPTLTIPKVAGKNGPPTLVNPSGPACT